MSERAGAPGPPPPTDSTAPPAQRRRRGRLLLAQLLPTVALVALFLWRVDLGEAVARLAAVDGRWLAGAGGALVGSKLLQAARWRLLLGRQRRSWRTVVAVFLVGALASALLPLRGGDVLRVQVAGRRLGIARAELVSSVFVLETLLDWIASVALLSVGVAFFFTLPAFARPLFIAFVLLAGATLVGAEWLARTNRERDFATLPGVRALPGPLRRLVAGWLPRFLVGFAPLRQPRLALPALALSLLIWLAEVAIYWCMGRAVGLPLRFTDYFLVMVGANVMLALPLTPWSVGSFEVAASEVAAALGAPIALAGSFALAAHLLVLLTVTALGLLAVAALRLEWRDLWGGRRRPGPPAPD